MSSIERTCPACNTAVPHGAKFCMNCGTSLPSFCSSCGMPVPPQAKFCMNCGTSTDGTPIPTPATSQPKPVATQTSDAQEPPSPPVQSPEMEQETEEVQVGSRVYQREGDLLVRTDDDGMEYVEAGSFFKMQQKERQAMQNASAHEAPLRQSDSGDDGYGTEEEPFEEDDFHASQGTKEVTEDELRSMPRPLAFLSLKKGKVSVKDDEHERFQNTVNQDGYYDDRIPLDSEYFREERKKVQWVAMILAVLGVALTAVIIIWAQGKLWG